MCAIEIFSIISTHDLTKRSTFQLREMNLTETFQLTTSRRGRLCYLQARTTKRYFNSRPHEEVDVSTAGDESYGNISTHDLTKRSTMLSSSEDNKAVFQLTTSRRGRLYLWDGVRGNVHFNSRPHEEVDQLKEPFPQEDQLFQLTTSRRGRLEGLRNSFNSWFISTHDLTKRSTRRCRSKIWFDIISTHDLTKRSTL